MRLTPMRMASLMALLPAILGAALPVESSMDPHSDVSLSSFAVAPNVGGLAHDSKPLFKRGIEIPRGLTGPGVKTSGSNRRVPFPVRRNPKVPTQNPDVWRTISTHDELVQHAINLQRTQREQHTVKVKYQLGPDKWPREYSFDV
jgi:hypothetical protein